MIAMVTIYIYYNQSTPQSSKNARIKEWVSSSVLYCVIMCIKYCYYSYNDKQRRYESEGLNKRSVNVSVKRKLKGVKNELVSERRRSCSVRGGRGHVNTYYNR